MPYIKKQHRDELDDIIKPLSGMIREVVVEDSGVTYSQIDPGLLNYSITKLILETGFKPSYSEYNKIIGVLECAKLEFYRRAVSVYEEGKIVQNGDVY